MMVAGQGFGEIAPMIALLALVFDMITGGLRLWAGFFGVPGRFARGVIFRLAEKLNRARRGAGVLRWRGALITAFAAIIALLACFFIPGSHPAASFAAGARALGSIAAPDAARGGAIFLAALGSAKSPYKQGAWLIAVQVLLFAAGLAVLAYMTARGG